MRQIRFRSVLLLTRVVVPLAFLVVCSMRLAAQPALQITSPVNGTVVTPGQNITVSVSATGSFAQVIVIAELPIGFSAPLTAPPYNFSISIPTDIKPGRYAVTASGAISPGQGVESEPIEVIVERADSPTQLRIEPSTLSLFIGERAPLRVIGVYSDGATTDLNESTLTTFESDTPGVATVNQYGIVSGVAPGSAGITITNGNASGWVQATVADPVTVVPPWRKLYPSQTQQFNARVTTSTNQAVTWSLSPNVGIISGTGLYTAPSSIASQQTVTVTATSVADNTRSGSAKAWLYPPVSVSVSPATAALGPSQTQQFTGTVLNAENIAVQWSLSPAGVGSISYLGLYTAPSTIQSQQTVTVTATSVADKTKTATATVTLTPP
ncbi:MAG: Ig-like domain-containing protein [Bryobacteraceae bacterium]